MKTSLAATVIAPTGCVSRLLEASHWASRFVAVRLMLDAAGASDAPLPCDLGNDDKCLGAALACFRLSAAKLSELLPGWCKCAGGVTGGCGGEVVRRDGGATTASDGGGSNVAACAPDLHEGGSPLRGCMLAAAVRELIPASVRDYLWSAAQGEALEVAHSSPKASVPIGCPAPEPRLLDGARPLACAQRITEPGRSTACLLLLLHHHHLLRRRHATTASRRRRRQRP